MSTAQKSIFITGAASGLGREVARYFANVGWFVGLADIDEKGLDATAALLPKGEYSRHKLDVTDRAQWKKAVADFAKHTNGHMTVLFNNAGIGSGGPIQDMTDEDIDRMIAINLTGVISGTRACFDLLKNTADACVLYTSSAAGIYGSAGLSVYSATKFAVRGLAEAHDIEWRPYGIKSRSLMPGFIDTNIIIFALKDPQREVAKRLALTVSPSATACSWCGLTTECGRHEDAAEWRRRKGGRVGVVASGRDRRGWVELEFRLSEVSSFLAGGYGSGLQQC